MSELPDQNNSNNNNNNNSELEFKIQIIFVKKIFFRPFFLPPYVNYCALTDQDMYLLHNLEFNCMFFFLRKLFQVF